MNAVRLFRRSGRLLTALGLMVLAAACSRPDDTPEGILRVSQRNEPADLDPARATLPDEFFILRALSEGLVAPDPDGGTPLPAAASRTNSRWASSSPRSMAVPPCGGSWW